MPQLHNETPSAQNKRLKAELANERATVAGLVEALTSIAHLRPAGDVERCANARKLVERMERLALAALKQANGKGL